MRNQTKSIIKSLTVAILTIAAAGCGAKVGTGTFQMSQIASNSNFIGCESISLNLTDSSSTITASGSSATSGITCTENLNGTENNNVITVSSLILTLSDGINCTFSGTLTESGSTFTGTLISTVSSTGYSGSNYSSNCGSLTVTGTKTN